jgi:hypothetical protein
MIKMLRKTREARSAPSRQGISSGRWGRSDQSIATYGQIASITPGN